MRPLLSHEFDLRVFCYQMVEKDPSGVMKAAFAEITYARHNHRERTTEVNFRGGSKVRKYCDDLKYLIRMLMNGQMPNDRTPECIEAVGPLVRHLLKKWRIGSLQEHLTE